MNIRCFGSSFRGEPGFTLVELIVVIVIAGIAIGISMGIMNIQSQTFVRLFTRNDLMTDAKSTLRQFRLDFQQMSPDSITTMTDTDFIFTDFDGNTVSYQFSGNTLTRNGSGFLQNLQAFPLNYLDNSLVPTTVPSELYCIQVDLNIQEGSETFRIQENIYARN